MAIELLPVTEKDINEIDQNLDVFQLTSAEKWIPRRFRVNGVTSKQKTNPLVYEPEPEVEQPIPEPLFSEFIPFEPEKHPVAVAFQGTQAGPPSLGTRPD